MGAVAHALPSPHPWRTGRDPSCFSRVWPCSVRGAASAAATLPPEAARHQQVDAYYIAIGAAFVSYVAALLVLLRARALLAPVLVIAALVQAIPLASPLRLSQDAGVYWDYARIAAVDGGNPYSDPPLRFRHDPAYPSVAGAWRETTSAYGPLFTAASEGGALVVGASPSAARSLFKTAAAVGVVALALLVSLVSPRPAFAAAAVGWNPLFAMHFGGGGHNDVWMMVPLVGALALDRRGRRHLAGALWAVAVAVKWIPLLLLPLRTSVREHSPRFGYAGFAAASLAVASVASILYGDKWLGAFGPVGHDVASGSATSIPHLLGRTGVGKVLASGALVLAFVIAYVALVVGARGRRARLGLATTFLLLATPWILLVRELVDSTRRRRRDDALALVLSVALTGYLLEARARCDGADSPRAPVPSRHVGCACRCWPCPARSSRQSATWTSRGGGLPAPARPPGGNAWRSRRGGRRHGYRARRAGDGDTGRSGAGRSGGVVGDSAMLLGGLTAADASRGGVRLATATETAQQGSCPRRCDAAAVRIGGFVYAVRRGHVRGAQATGSSVSGPEEVRGTSSRACRRRAPTRRRR